MDRLLDQETVEGEIALVIDYKAGESLAVDVLQAAMELITSIDRLDRVLLSCVDTSLEPVSILNDVQQSSLKMMLARALKKIPDEHLKNLDWRKWVGSLLVAGKHKLLSKIEASPAELQKALIELAPEYKKAPTLITYDPPSTADIKDALNGVAKARARLPDQKVIVQTEFGDILLPETGHTQVVIDLLPTVANTVINRGEEIFKIKSPDMLGEAQWIVLRDQKQVRINMLDAQWLLQYQNRLHTLLPRDGLLCSFEEKIEYDHESNEISRTLAIIKVLKIIPPQVQTSFVL